MNHTFHFFKGRVALYAILKAIGTQPSDEIIVPGFTCVVVPNAITYLGATPTYVDIDPTTYNIDPVKLRELFRSGVLKRPKALLVQHTFGIPADMDRIIAIAKKYHVWVIEDSCHALGSQYRGKETGSFGDASFFSSQWSKPVTTGLGGWAIINNPVLLDRMRAVSGSSREPSSKEVFLLRMQHLAHRTLFRPSLYWRLQKMYRALSATGITLGSSSSDELRCEMPQHYAQKMSRWQERLLESKLEDLKKMLAHRKSIASYYTEVLRRNGLQGLELPTHLDSVLLRYPVIVKEKEDVLKRAKEKGIELGDWFVSPIHPNLTKWDRAGYIKGSCPVSEKICRTVVNMPTHEKIGIEEARRTVDFILESCRTRS